MTKNNNPAKDVLWPSDPNILVRVVFLYVGQGSSTLILAAVSNDIICGAYFFTTKDTKKAIDSFWTNIRYGSGFKL